MSAPAFDGEVLVLGLGAVGAATLYQLARRRGARVAGLDQYEPPHELGSSHGESRITRLATAEGDDYVQLVRRSHRLWRELEAASGQTLYSACGGLVLGEAGSRGDFLGRTVERAQRHGIVHQLYDAGELRRRFPALQPRADERGYFEPEAGYLRPEAAIRAQLEQARRLGAAVHGGERVRALEPQGERLRVLSERDDGERRVHLCDRLVLAAGSWLPGLLGGLGPAAAWREDFGVYRQVMYWFDAGQARAPDFGEGRLPIFIWAHGPGEEDSFYGFPAAAATPGRFKVASAQYRTTTSPEAVSRRVTQQEARDFFAQHLDGRLAVRRPRCVETRVCLYTATPDRHFVIDTLPGWPAVLLASACSGHGFKHSAALGEALAERVLGLAPTLDLRPFARPPRGGRDAAAAA